VEKEEEAGDSLLEAGETVKGILILCEPPEF
jgi:hypothetical protein